MYRQQLRIYTPSFLQNLLTGSPFLITHLRFSLLQLTSKARADPDRPDDAAVKHPKKFVMTFCLCAPPQLSIHITSTQHDMLQNESQRETLSSRICTLQRCSSLKDDRLHSRREKLSKAMHCHFT